MKKYLILLSFIFLFFVGCGRNNGQQMSFLTAYKKASTNIQTLGTNIFGMGFSDKQEKQYNFDIFSENSDFKLQAKIVEEGLYNYKNNTSQTNNKININFFDKLENNYNNISGEIYNIELENHFYTKIGDFYVNMGTGNYQNKLLSLILDKINNKRIRIKSPIKKLQEIQLDIRHLYSQISQSSQSGLSGGLGNIFYVTEKTSYNGDLAYKISFNSGFKHKLKENADIDVSKFQGALIVHSLSDIELKIEKLYLTGQYNINIAGYISSQKGELKIKNNINTDKTIVVGRNQNRKNISLFINSLKNLNQLWGLELNLFAKDIWDNQIENKIIQINGLLSVSPLLIYGSNLEKNIQIDINGQYEFSKIENLNILKPDSYILIDQILGDQFSLKTLQNIN